MPITLSNVTITRNLQTLLFAEDGSLNATFVKAENGVPVSTESYRIEAANVSTSILDVMPATGVSIRDQIMGSVYTYLVDANLIPGTVTVP